jgi:hypothetical protein
MKKKKMKFRWKEGTLVKMINQMLFQVLILVKIINFPKSRKIRKEKRENKRCKKRKKENKIELFKERLTKIKGKRENKKD